MMFGYQLLELQYGRTGSDSLVLVSPRVQTPVRLPTASFTVDVDPGRHRGQLCVASDLNTTPTLHAILEHLAEAVLGARETWTWPDMRTYPHMRSILDSTSHCFFRVT